MQIKFNNTLETCPGQHGNTKGSLVSKQGRAQRNPQERFAILGLRGIGQVN